jgi:AcrR family transcriptional regulator
MAVNLTPPEGLRADAARNRAKVLDVARRQLAAGERELSMNTIAGLAGVGVGTVYRHFPTRQALLESLAMESLERLAADMQAAAEEDDPAAGLERVLRGALTLQLEDVGLKAALELPEDLCGQTSAVRLAMGESARRLLDRARAAGVLKEDIGLDDLRRLLAGVAHAARLAPAGPEEADRYLGVLLDGLRPRAR